MRFYKSFRNWELRLEIRNRQAKRLPPDYSNYEKSGEMIVLPGQCYKPGEYFQDLIDQLRDDIYPLFLTVGGAPFTVTRNIFCYVDHLSQLVHGVGGSQNKRMKKVIKELGATDSTLSTSYSRYADYLVQIYRHDLVHNVRPLPKLIKIEKNGVVKREVWFRTISPVKEDVQLGFESNRTRMSDAVRRSSLKHLKVVNGTVTIDTFRLFFDVILLLDDYKNRVMSDEKLRNKIVSNYYRIISGAFYSMEKFSLEVEAPRSKGFEPPNAGTKS